jgi:hypothetical protein
MAVQPYACAELPSSEFECTGTNRPVNGTISDGVLVGLLALEERLFDPTWLGYWR